MYSKCLTSIECAILFATSLGVIKVEYFLEVSLRIILACFIAMVISEPIQLVIFEKEICNSLEDRIEENTSHQKNNKISMYEIFYFKQKSNGFRISHPKLKSVFQEIRSIFQVSFKELPIFTPAKSDKISDMELTAYSKFLRCIQSLLNGSFRRNYVLLTNFMKKDTLPYSILDRVINITRRTMNKIRKYSEVKTIRKQYSTAFTIISKYVIVIVNFLKSNQNRSFSCSLC